jgi:hypothetical protein
VRRKEDMQQNPDDDDAYLEFERALSDVLAEEEYSLARRSRLARARANIKLDDPRYAEAVKRADSAIRLLKK